MRVVTFNYGQDSFSFPQRAQRPFSQKQNHYCVIDFDQVGRVCKWLRPNDEFQMGRN